MLQDWIVPAQSNLEVGASDEESSVFTQVKLTIQTNHYYHASNARVNITLGDG